MIVNEIQAKTILSRSKVLDYTINPYVGCAHGCTYCYARFMKRYTDHQEDWGQFVDVKTNAAQLLPCEVGRKRVGTVWISGVCDPYQPLEREYELTRQCLRILSQHDWPVTIQTKSPLILRDTDILRNSPNSEAGLTITTADEHIRTLFEPNAPPIQQRITTLEKLHMTGIKTYAMIAPILPKAESLPKQLRGKVDNILIDKMNYHHADWVYTKHGLEHAMTPDFFTQKKRELAKACIKEEIPYRILF